MWQDIVMLLILAPQIRDGKQGPYLRSQGRGVKVGGGREERKRSVCVGMCERKRETAL